MAKGIVALKLFGKNAMKLHTLAGIVSKGFAAQSLIFNSPHPALSVLDNANAALLAGIKAWGEKGNRGSHNDWLNLQTQMQNIREMLSTLSNYAQQVTTDRNVLSTIGWELKRERTPAAKLAEVTDLHQVFPKNLSRGTLKLKWKRPLETKRGDVNNYLIYRSLTPDFSDAEFMGSVTVTSFIDMAPGEGKRYYWITPCNSFGEGVRALIVASAPAAI